MNATPPKLIGPAGQLAELFARTLEDAATVKLLLTGTPGVGKTALADSLALALCGGKFAVESVNGRKCSIHVVAEWQRMCATSCMFGTGWRAFVINEVDTCPADAQDLLLTFLDEMPASCAFIATSNLELDKLTPRFISRLERHEVTAPEPEPEEIAAFLVREHACPPLVAQQIAFLCGGNVRAAEILPSDEECQRVIKELEGEPTLTQWASDFIDSNRGRLRFTDRQKEIIAEFQERFDV